MANNAPYAIGPISNAPRMNAVAVTPGTTVYNPPLTKLYVGGAGNLVVTMAQSGTVTLAVAAGAQIDDLAILNVGTATTANGLIGFW